MHKRTTGAIGTINPYKRTAAWVAVVFIILMFIPLLNGNLSGWAYFVLGGMFGAVIGMLWEHAKHPP